VALEAPPAAVAVVFPDAVSPPDLPDSPADALAELQAMTALHVGEFMQVVQNAKTETWHLVGRRECGADPDGETVEGTWAVVRDTVDRADGDRCGNCRWP
jgi:hypothetical protein